MSCMLVLNYFCNFFLNAQDKLINSFCEMNMQVLKTYECHVSVIL